MEHSFFIPKNIVTALLFLSVAVSLVRRLMPPRNQLQLWSFISKTQARLYTLCLFALALTALFLLFNTALAVSDNDQESVHTSIQMFGLIAIMLVFMIFQLKKKVATASSTEKVRQINIADLSCTCSDWRKNRSTLARNHCSRLCKHLTAYFSDYPEEIPSFLKEYGSLIRGCGLRAQGMPVQNKDCLVVCDTVIGIPYLMEAHQKTYPLVTVLVAENRFVYHVKKQRWEKNRSPENARLFEEKIERRVAGRMSGRRRKQAEKRTEHVPRQRSV
ncbi:hypothetical protein LJC22_03570 [Desulfosarcina sp. OttesenSCG-928-G10]|nr:hypothetical protein [Desulfosarcina sp. OttesenSCG-928-G10]MDL2322059.1 hypothetical protein [Desulfosarcina sp. OttesenSCG-928-B08]